MGLGIFLGSVAGVIAYFYIVFLSPWSVLAIQLTAFIAVAGVLGILAWIGYTLATTPPPKPIEEIEMGKEASKQGEERKAE